jgi:hypothetical protein
MRLPVVPLLFPYGRLVLAAGALAALAGFHLRHHTPASGHYRLELRITQTDQEECFYGSAWYSGAPETSRADTAMTLESTYDFIDGCNWEVTETLVPRGDGTFDYEYREHVGKCEEDAEPGLACVRSGIVTAVPIE